MNSIPVRRIERFKHAGSCIVNFQSHNFAPASNGASDVGNPLLKTAREITAIESANANIHFTVANTTAYPLA
jgi:hypothetical protein